MQAWDKIPDGQKDANGAYYADYTGIMSVGWNADKYGDINSLDAICSTRNSPAPWPSTASQPRLAPPSTAT